MKTDVTLKEIGFRTKAISNEIVIKTVPKPFIGLVQSLGYIDIRTNKKTLNGACFIDYIL